MSSSSASHDSHLLPKPPPPPMRVSRVVLKRREDAPVDAKEQAPVDAKEQAPNAKEQALATAKRKAPPTAVLAIAEIQPYSKVRLRGLKATPELNGCVGVVLPAILAEVQEEPGTLQIRIDMDEDEADLAVYPHQLEPLEGPRNVLSSLTAKDQELLKVIQAQVRGEAGRKLVKMKATEASAAGKKPGPKAAPKPPKAAPKGSVVITAIPKSSICSSSIVPRAVPKAMTLGPPPTRQAPPAPPSSSSAPPNSKPSKPPSKKSRQA